jgi:membrane-bound lytic murein transglycosylase A
MHVQGGGHITIESGGKTTSKYLSYAGTNGLSWNFISKYMMEKNYIQDPSIIAQRSFLEATPHKEQEIYATCPSYVYFKESDHPPLGSDRVPLTDNRSIATDTRYYRFKGLLSFVKTERPTEAPSRDCEQLEFKSFSRFFLDQDTGGAIRGKGRVDLYFGEGSYAEKTAYNLVRRGDLFFLMLKR